jgi:hypothetical protein
MRAFNDSHVVHPDEFKVPPDEDLEWERRYRECVKTLPLEIRTLTGKAILQFYRDNPDHPRLHTVAGPQPPR